MSLHERLALEEIERARYDLRMALPPIEDALAALVLGKRPNLGPIRERAEEALSSIRTAAAHLGGDA